MKWIFRFVICTVCDMPLYAWCCYFERRRVVASLYPTVPYYCMIRHTVSYVLSNIFLNNSYKTDILGNIDHHLKNYSNSFSIVRLYFLFVISLSVKTLPNASEKRFLASIFLLSLPLIFVLGFANLQPRLRLR